MNGKAKLAAVPVPSLLPTAPLPANVVTTPAGCTIDGLLELEEGGLRVTLIKAVVRAAQRARQLVESQNT